MDCSPPDSSVHGILQAGILQWVAMPSSRGSSWPRNQFQISLCLLCWQVGSLPVAPPGKPIFLHIYVYFYAYIQIYIKYKFICNGERVCKPDARVDRGGQFKDQNGDVLPLDLPTNKMQLCNLTLNSNKEIRKATQGCKHGYPCLSC